MSPSTSTNRIKPDYFNMFSQPHITNIFQLNRTYVIRIIKIATVFLRNENICTFVVFSYTSNPALSKNPEKIQKNFLENPETSYTYKQTEA